MSSLLLVCAIILAIGTYAFRVFGLVVSARVELGEKWENLMGTAAIFLIAGVLITSTFLQDDNFAGMARILGVTVAGIALACRVRLIAAIVIAVMVTALARLAGIQ